MNACRHLREATRDLHQRVEQTTASHLLFSAELNLDTYAQVLARFFAAVEPLERGLQGHTVCREVGSQPRSHDLRHDLYALGWSEPQIAEIPRMEIMPHLPSPGMALGVVYVLQGSRSWAPYIRRRVEQTVGRGHFAEGGLCFFGEPDPLHVAQRWEGFCARLNNWFELHSAAEVVEATQGALQAFAAFEGALAMQRKAA